MIRADCQNLVKKKIIFVLLIIWCLFLARTVLFEIRVIIKDYPYLYSIDLKKKYELIDGKYYKFMNNCLKIIPKDADILFIIEPKEKVQKFMSYEWTEAEYYFQKAPYFLYPRRVFRGKNETSDLFDYRILCDIEKKEFFLQKKRL